MHAAASSARTSTARAMMPSRGVLGFFNCETSFPMWTATTILATVLAAALTLSTPTSSSSSPPSSAPCDIVAFGATAGNETAFARINSAAILAAVGGCGGEAVVPAGVFKIAPLVLPSHSVLRLATPASMLVGSDLWQDWGPAVPFLPPMGSSGTQPGRLQFSPLLAARYAENVSIVGAPGAVIDGLGWQWWHQAGAPPVMRNNTWAPHLFTCYHCANTRLVNVTFANPPYWGLQHFFANDTLIQDIRVVAPRWTAEIAGLMPFSVLRYTALRVFVDVGDDAVAIMSGPDYDPRQGPPHIAAAAAPTSGVVMRQLQVLSRSIAIGSEDFGNVTEVLIEDSAIGDDNGSCPWAFKIKMHSNILAYVANITIRNVRLGRIQPNPWQQPKPEPAIQMALAYDDPPIDPARGQPHIANITLTNVTATWAVLPGAFVGSNVSLIRGLHFANVTLPSTQPWAFQFVDLASCSFDHVLPPPPAGGTLTSMQARPQQ